MRGSTHIGVAIACLLVGLGAGYLLFGSESAPPPLPDTDLRADDGGVGAGRTSSGPQLTSAEAGGVADPLRVALHAVPLPPAEEGDGVIQGLVSDEAGVGIEGVRMVLTAVPDAQAYVKPDPDADQDALLLRQLRRSIETHRWGSAYRQVTTTDAGGRYRFEGVTARKHRVEAHREAYWISPRDHRSWHGVSPGATVDFLARATAQLRIEVVGSVRPERLRVELRSENGGQTGMQWTPSQPVLDCQPGTWNVHLRGGTHDELGAGPFPVELVAGTEETRLQVELEARPVLRLHLTYAKDEILPLQIYLMPTPSSGLPTKAVLKARGAPDPRRGGLHWSRLSATAKEHVETYTDLQPGPHVVGLAFDRNGSIFHMEEIVVTAGVVDHTVQVPPLDPALYLIVGVVGPDGEAVTGANFSAGFRSKNESSSGGSTVGLRPDGRYLVLHQPGSPDAEDAEWWIDVQVQRLGSQRVTYQRDQVREVRVAFAEPADLEIELRGVSGTPYEGRISVAAYPGDDKRRGGYGGSTEPGAEGRLHIRTIQPGPARLVASVQDADRRTYQVSETALVVKPGPQRVTLTIPPLHMLSVRGASSHVSLRGTAADGQRISRHARADTEGLAVFDGLPAGTYKLRSRRLEAEVTLPGPREVTLEARKR